MLLDAEKFLLFEECDVLTVFAEESTMNYLISWYPIKYTLLRSWRRSSRKIPKRFPLKNPPSKELETGSICRKAK
ncbi:hypothetical protein IRB23M11_23950 [Alkalibacterium sp. m-11]